MSTTPSHSLFHSAALALPEMRAFDQFLSSRRTRRAAAALGRRFPERNVPPSVATAANLCAANGSPDVPRSRVASSVGPRRPRVALYSHDTLGLGHLRRNLLIAEKLAKGPLQATVLLITGAHEANFFKFPPGVDCLTLPRLQKDADGSYASGQLAISVNDLVRLRAEAILSSLEAFAPDLLIVDKVPTGAFGELLPTLRTFQNSGGVQCVLGIRDVLDDAETVRCEWQKADSENAVAQFYDQIWVYGDRTVYDPIAEYQWSPPLSQRVRFTGYLDQTERGVGSVAAPTPSLESLLACGKSVAAAERAPLAVCTLGGGQDGFDVGESFIYAIGGAPLRGLLITGPFLPADQLQRLRTIASLYDNTIVVDFTPAADQLVRQADRVVSMAGYNTVCSILSYRRPSLLVPRVAPRQEQWIRAERLQSLGLVDVLHPDRLTPSAVRDWLLAPMEPTRNVVAVDLHGLDRVQEFAANLVAQ